MSQILSNLTIPSNNLIGRSTIMITLTIYADTRRTSKTVTFYIKDRLCAYIDVLFNTPKVEPSLDTFIQTEITSKVSYNISWSEVKGDILSLSDNYPVLFLAQNTLSRGIYYSFMISALQLNCNSANAYATFITNMAPVCGSSMSIVPSIGLALNTYFDFSINLCTDPDQDLPLLYRFKIITQDSESFIMSSAKQFNFITSAMFEGNLTGHVDVCDQLYGCSSYQNNFTVTSNTIRTLSTSDILLQNYIAHTSNIELIPLFSIAYLQTYALTAEEVAYIYNDVLNSYIASRNSITSEIVEIFLSFINKILYTVQEEFLTFTTIELYLNEIINLVEISTEKLSSNRINLIFSVAENTLIKGNFTSDYIYLVDNFLTVLIEDYSLGMLPGTVIADIQAANNIYYYKERGLSQDYTNTSINFIDGIKMNIVNLSSNPDTIINIIVSIYPQPDNFSNIIAISFTSSGTYINQVLNMTSEQAMNLSESTVQVLIPFNKEISED